MFLVSLGQEFGGWGWGVGDLNSRNDSVPELNNTMDQVNK